MYWPRKPTQGVLGIGTIESGYSLVVTFMWAQSCIIATYPTNFTSLFWYEMLVYYIFHIIQSQVFFFSDKQHKSEKRMVRRHKSGNTIHSCPIFLSTNKETYVSVKVRRQIQIENWYTMNIMCLAT